MIRTAIRLILLLVVGILVYNFFFGTTTEKEEGKRIVSEFKDVGVAIKDLLSSEKQKLDEGKYDDALDKVGNLFQKVRNGIEKIDPNAIPRLDRLEDKRRDIEREVERKNQGELTDQEKEELNAEMEELLQETERLMEDVRAKTNEE